MAVCYEEWAEGLFLKLSPNDIEEKMNEWNKTMYRLVQKAFKDLGGPQSVTGAVREKLDAFRPNLQLIAALRREGMQERHWDTITAQKGLSLKSILETTLNYLLEMGLLNHMAIIETVSGSVATEHKLERELTEMEEAWKTQEFQTLPYKEIGTCELCQVYDII
jgi:dynein heavy chain